MNSAAVRPFLMVAATCDYGSTTRTKAVLGATPGCASSVEETVCNVKALYHHIPLGPIFPSVLDLYR
jgi:hypothetical protein